jgi:hypothetical protein
MLLVFSHIALSSARALAAVVFLNVRGGSPPIGSGNILQKLNLFENNVEIED